MEDETGVESADLQQKEQALRDALVKHPQSAGLSFRLAVLLRRQERYAEALDMAEACMAIQPGNVQFLRLRIRMLLLLGRLGEAENAVNQALRQNPDSAEVYLLSALVHLENMRPGEAHKAIDGAMQRGPGIEQLQRMKTLQRRINALLRKAENQPVDWLVGKFNRRIARVAEERGDGD